MCVRVCVRARVCACVCEHVCINVAACLHLAACRPVQVSQSRIGAELDPHSVLFQDLVAHSKNDAASQASTYDRNPHP